MPCKAKAFSPVQTRANDALSANPESIRAREYAQAQYGWDVQYRRILNKHRTRKMRELDKMEKTLAYEKMSSEEQEAETVALLSSMAKAMQKELDESYAEWQEKTDGKDLNVGSRDEDSEQSDLKEEYEEWHGIGVEPNTEIEGTVDVRLHQLSDHHDLAEGISKIWKRFEKKYQKTVDLYAKIGAIEEGEENMEQTEQVYGCSTQCTRTKYI